MTTCNDMTESEGDRRWRELFSGAVSFRGETFIPDFVIAKVLGESRNKFRRRVRKSARDLKPFGTLPVVEYRGVRVYCLRPAHAQQMVFSSRCEIAEGMQVAMCRIFDKAMSGKLVPTTAAATIAVQNAAEALHDMGLGELVGRREPD